MQNLTTAWLNELEAWLRATNDPRLVETEGHVTIERVAGASADFCEFLAQCCDAGFTAQTWREYLRRN